MIFQLPKPEDLPPHLMRYAKNHPEINVMAQKEAISSYLYSLSTMLSDLTKELLTEEDPDKRAAILKKAAHIRQEYEEVSAIRL